MQPDRERNRQEETNMGKTDTNDNEKLKICMLGHKRVPSRERGIEIVVEELAARMAALGHSVVCYNRSGHHVGGREFDSGYIGEYKGIQLRDVFTIDKRAWLLCLPVFLDVWRQGWDHMMLSTSMQRGLRHFTGYRDCLVNG